jgi:hypothetical protein
VSFDVGGTVYTSSRQTFSAVSDSWFTKLFSGEIIVPKTAQDVRFIDRDAKVRAMFTAVKQIEVCLRGGLVAHAKLVCCYFV